MLPRVNDQRYKLFGASFNIIILLGALITVTGTLGSSVDIALADNVWYVGDGAKQGLFLKYSIQDHDTRQGKQFEMTIYFKNFSAVDHYWIAPTFVLDNGKVINGTFHLSELDLTALGSSSIPKEMLPYKSAYTDTLQWLAAFVPKPGQSLTAPYWGKIASIGGQAIAPSGQEKVTVPAGTFDTTKISWHKGKDNNIWINNNLPYPVKAETFADVTTGIPPIQYKFQLLQAGQGEPAMPKSKIQIPTPPLMQQTLTGKYYIQLMWDPQSIQIGKDIKFGLLFLDNAKSIIRNVAYNFEITDANGTVLADLKNLRAIDGTGIQTFKFKDTGQIIVIVDINAVAGLPSGIFVENAKFPLVVVK
ncbi:MAG TPA: hypothetical protein VH415_16910 [Nitrososphaeraceae archaeon]